MLKSNFSPLTCRNCSTNSRNRQFDTYYTKHPIHKCIHAKNLQSVVAVRRLVRQLIGHRRENVRESGEALAGTSEGASLAPQEVYVELGSEQLQENWIQHWTKGRHLLDDCPSVSLEHVNLLREMSRRLEVGCRRVEVEVQAVHETARKGIVRLQ